MTTIRSLALLTAFALFARAADDKLPGMKADVMGEIEQMRTRTQIMVDSIFSFGELGFQEYETQKYLTGILEKEGFKVEKGISGIPTAWVATWARANPSSRSAQISTTFSRPPTDKPAIWLNQGTMAKYRDEMKKYYYDPTKYKSCLDQLGIGYPAVR